MDVVCQSGPDKGVHEPCPDLGVDSVVLKHILKLSKFRRRRFDAVLDHYFVVFGGNFHAQVFEDGYVFDVFVAEFYDGGFTCCFLQISVYYHGLCLFS